MNFITDSRKNFKPSDYEYYVIGADIGGTNTRIGFAGVKKNKFELLFSLNYASNSFKSLSKVLNHAKKTAKDAFEITPKQVCLGCAGPIIKNRNVSEMTHTPWNVDRRKLMAQTRLKILPLLNDLEAIGYSLDYLGKKQLHTINSGKKVKDGTKIVVAAGTGLGKCKVYKENDNKFVIPSEFGNNDFSATSQEDLKLAEFIQKKRKLKAPAQFEDVMSGPGIENIYDFLRRRKKSNFAKEIEKSPSKSVAIMNYRKKDATCRETIKLFSKYFGRFVKNAAFDDLPLGGIYIGGGIATANPEILGKEFIKEFMTSETHQNLLKSIPIFVILNDDAGLIGACSVAAKN